jgi:hypothetical protein
MAKADGGQYGKCRMFCLLDGGSDPFSLRLARATALSRRDVGANGEQNDKVCPAGPKGGVIRYYR